MARARALYHFIARALDIRRTRRHCHGRDPCRGGYHVSCARTRRRADERRVQFAHDDYQGGDVASKMAALHARTR
jgi:hypothetical protein